MISSFGPLIFPHLLSVLSQTQNDDETKSLGYFSKKLNSTEGRYSATDKEALAIVLACHQFHHYLWGTKFTILANHQPLTSRLKKKTKSARMSRWIMEMREYHYEIKYVQGIVTDSFSPPHS